MPKTNPAMISPASTASDNDLSTSAENDVSMANRGGTSTFGGRPRTEVSGNDSATLKRGVQTSPDNGIDIIVYNSHGDRLIALPAALGGAVILGLTLIYPSVAALVVLVTLFRGIRMTLESDPSNGRRQQNQEYDDIY